MQEFLENMQKSRLGNNETTKESLTEDKMDVDKWNSFNIFIVIFLWDILIIYIMEGKENIWNSIENIECLNM